jgi:hypothetical protein
MVWVDLLSFRAVVSHTVLEVALSEGTTERVWFEMDNWLKILMLHLIGAVSDILCLMLCRQLLFPWLICIYLLAPIPIQRHIFFFKLPVTGCCCKSARRCGGKETLWTR